MLPLLVALAVAAAEPAAPEPAAQAAFPAGAPQDDYRFVSWCYGALRGYLDLYDEVMPEVRRIETAFRRPGSDLQSDLAVYAQMRREGQANLKAYTRAMEAAEKASLKPLNTQGAEAVKKGRATWAAAANLPKARVAQEWMSWALPARCNSTAASLEQRAKLLGTAFQAPEAPDLLSAPEAQPAPSEIQAAAPDAEAAPPPP